MKKSLILAALAASSAFGYFRDTYTPPGGLPILLQRADAAKLQVYLNSGVKAGAISAISTPANNLVISAGSDPFGAIQTALTVWNAVPTANIRFQSLKLTDKGHTGDDLLNVIVIAAGAADLSVVGATGTSKGALAVTDNRFVVEDGELNGVALTKGTIFDSDIVINPNFLFSTEGTANSTDFQSVMTHELGHLLGSNHSAILGATMYPFAGPAQRVLSADDVAYATAVYPAKGTALGTLAGKVFQSDGATAVKTPIITFLDQSTGNMIGTLGAPDGSYSVSAPAGNYIMYAEPFNAFVSAANFYFVDATQVSTGYLPTFLGTAASPQTVSVTAGATTTVPDLRVTQGTSSLQVPLVGTGVTGANGDIRSVLELRSANVLVSGQTFDLGFVSGGVDSTTTFQIFGPSGAKVNSVRVDSAVNFGGLPLIRANITLPVVQKSSLATLMITKGTSVTAITGVFIVVPPTPVISSVQDSQSARKSIVGGSWIALYGSNLAPAGTRIWGDRDFVNGDLLPRSLDGVSVAINGLPASIYYTLPGQMGIQAPSDLGPFPQVDVVVTNNGSVSRAFKTDVALYAPSLFVYPAGAKTYPAAVHLSGQLIGDPFVTQGSAKAKAGETILLFVNGLGTSPSASLIAAPIEFTKDVTVTVGGQAAQVTFKGVVAAGLFQLNVILPKGLGDGDSAITVFTQSLSSPGGVTIPIGQ